MNFHFCFTLSSHRNLHVRQKINMLLKVWSAMRAATTKLLGRAKWRKEICKKFLTTCDVFHYLDDDDSTFPHFSIFSFQSDEKKETKNQPQQPPQRAVSFFVSKTINSVLKSSRKIIFRVCEVANVKKPFKMFQMYSTMQRRHNSDQSESKEPETTGHDRFYQERSR